MFIIIVQKILPNKTLFIRTNRQLLLQFTYYILFSYYTGPSVGNYLKKSIELVIDSYVITIRIITFCWFRYVLYILVCKRNIFE